MADLTFSQLAEIFSDTFRRNPRAYADSIERMGGDDYENPIVYEVLNSSPGVQYARQALPNNLGETGAGKWIRERLPEKYQSYVDRVPLGGMTGEEREAYSHARANDPRLRYQTVELGRVDLGAGEVPVGDNVRAAAAQAAGVAAADVATDGLRNIWWFLNAPQALAQIAVLSATHRAGEEYKPGSANVPLLKNRNMRMAATLPAVIGASLAIGNAYRMPGYKAAVPSESDPTQTADPLAEIGSRYILGRSGGLLPYEQFVQERPDVSRGEYENYKQYLFGNALPLKATLDGIHGPEVTFMGRSIPVMTGILPAIAAVAGARYGVRKAAANLAGYQMDGKRISDNNLLEKAEELRVKAKKAYSKGPAAHAAAYRAYNEQQKANEAKVLRNALLYSGGSMGATAIAGQTLESLRRALKGNVPVEEEQQETLKPPANPLNVG